MEKGKLYDAVITEWTGEKEEILAEVTESEDVAIYYCDGIEKYKGETVAVYTRQVVSMDYFMKNAKLKAEPMVN